MQEQRILRGLQSRSRRLAVAAIDFGTTYSGFAFSWTKTWTDVQCSQWCNGSIMPYKTPTVLLLNPDQTFLAFGYDAENLISEQKDDPDPEKDRIRERKYEMRKYYYFYRFKMLLFENEVIILFEEIKLLGSSIRYDCTFLKINYLTSMKIESYNAK